MRDRDDRIAELVCGVFVLGLPALQYFLTVLFVAEFAWEVLDARWGFWVPRPIDWSASFPAILAVAGSAFVARATVSPLMLCRLFRDQWDGAA